MLITSPANAAYATLYKLPLAHNPMFEAYTASFGFASSIIFFSSLHKFVKIDPLVHRLDKLPVNPVNTFEWLGSRGVKPFFDCYVPLVVYLLCVFLFHSFVTKPPLPLPSDTLTMIRFLTELVSGVILYDFIFSFVHKALHSRNTPQFIRRLHVRHHQRRPNQTSLLPIQTVQHGFVDGALQVLTNVFVQRLPIFFGLSKHPLSRIAHNLLVTFLLVESHSGYSGFKFLSHNFLPGILGGSPQHHNHHILGEKHHHQFLKI